MCIVARLNVLRIALSLTAGSGGRVLLLLVYVVIRGLKQACAVSREKGGLLDAGHIVVVACS